MSDSRHSQPICPHTLRTVTITLYTKRYHKAAARANVFPFLFNTVTWSSHTNLISSLLSNPAAISLNMP
jgi:hypothetical protein